VEDEAGNLCEARDLKEEYSTVEGLYV